jgi:hypothetical protein
MKSGKKKRATKLLQVKVKTSVKAGAVGNAKE